MTTPAKHNLVDEIAKMLDSEGAFAEFYNLADPSGRGREPAPPVLVHVADSFDLRSYGVFQNSVVLIPVHSFAKITQIIHRDLSLRNDTEKT